MKKLDAKQIRFLQWIIDTQENKMNSIIAEIILEQGIYGTRMQILLNELVDIYRQEYLKYTNSWDGSLQS